MSTQKELLREIEAFLREAGMAASTFGEQAVNDRSLIDDLRRGREVRSATLNKIRTCIERIRAGKLPGRRRRGRPRRPSLAAVGAAA